ncbi:hypothetical protein BDV38DRAFT_262707 [Aspergillus pseudotamarii]|uniref:Uncharacterized protein n=1 Tax=Aspergillus pseudotamarii TaxID=132259 RepID=A0A5N6SDG2_ASPPS|nr:uncharacterized protein BDV38DRAFT_262707 [Aspergillus pseudotamarii]KAE8131977.1 hypothetical protein BDV38DRAFT_262707 [Aspergillus pseudotamarii]
MANGWSLIIGLIVIAVASVVVWIFSPKGENQTLWRSTLILSFVSCYLMWGMFISPFLFLFPLCWLWVLGGVMG